MCHLTTCVCMCVNDRCPRVWLIGLHEHRRMSYIYEDCAHVDDIGVWMMCVVCISVDDTRTCMSGDACYDDLCASTFLDDMAKFAWVSSVFVDKCVQMANVCVVGAPVCECQSVGDIYLLILCVDGTAREWYKGDNIIVQRYPTQSTFHFVCNLSLKNVSSMKDNVQEQFLHNSLNILTLKTLSKGKILNMVLLYFLYGKT